MDCNIRFLPTLKRWWATSFTTATYWWVHLILSEICLPKEIITGLFAPVLPLDWWLDHTMSWCGKAPGSSTTASLGRRTWSRPLPLPGGLPPQHSHHPYLPWGDQDGQKGFSEEEKLSWSPPVSPWPVYTSSSPSPSCSSSESAGLTPGCTSIECALTTQEGTAPRSLTTALSRLLPFTPLWTSAWTPPTSTEMFFENPDEAKCGGNLVFQLVNTVATEVHSEGDCHDHLPWGILQPWWNPVQSHVWRSWKKFTLHSLQSFSSYNC